MTNIVKRGLDKDLEDKILTDLLHKIRKAETVKEFREIINSLLTNEERIMVYKRLAAADFLRKGKKYKEIGEILDVSPATISFIKRGLINFPKKEKKARKLTSSDFKKDRRSSPFLPPIGKGRWS